MNHYQFNIGDYRRRTGHLTHLEHGIYRSLIDTYYLTENPLDENLDKLMRSHSVRSADEQEAFKNVIEEFFFIDNFGYKHAHCDQELAKIYAKSEKARASAKARWLKSKDIDAVALQTDSERNAVGMLPITHNPLPITQSSTSSEDDLFIKPKVEKVKYQGVIDCYHKYCPDLTKVMKLTEARKKQVKARWNESEEYQNGEFWAFYFQTVAASDFLCGRSSDWKADFQWLTKQENFIKVMEGKYV